MPNITGESQSLCIQGFIRNCTWRDGAWKRGLNPFEIRVSFEPLLCSEENNAQKSQSLRDQGFIRTQHQTLPHQQRLSQSLRDQGFIRTWIQSQGSFALAGLNPFEIRVSFELLRLPEPSRRGLPREYFQFLFGDGDLTRNFDQHQAYCVLPVPLGKVGNFLKKTTATL